MFEGYLMVNKNGRTESNLKRVESCKRRCDSRVLRGNKSLHRVDISFRYFNRIYAYNLRSLRGSSSWSKGPWLARDFFFYKCCSILGGISFVEKKQSAGLLGLIFHLVTSNCKLSVQKVVFWWLYSPLRCRISVIQIGWYIYSLVASHF